MSATNRGATRIEADYYPTPEWCVRALLADCPLPGGTWLEPAVGDGAIVRAAWPMRPNVTWIACDIRDSLEHKDLVSAFQQGDFLDWHWNEPWQSISVVITNPPYSLAEAFVRKALENPNAVVVMLLRLNWLASQKRAAFLREHTPSVYVLPRRPSFTGHGTDATDYAWMVWDRSRPPTVRILRLEDCR
jgi:hypothetical protein